MSNLIICSINNKKKYTYNNFYEFYTIFEVNLGDCINIEITKDNFYKIDLLIEKAKEELNYYKEKYSSYYNYDIVLYRYIIRTLKVLKKNFIKNSKISIFVE